MSFILTHFVHPGLLAGLAVVAAPILIWLFSRLRFKTIEWAAQTFLLRAMKRSQRRLRIENLLLLLIRCLIIALFVIALARPRGEPVVLSDTTDARRNVVVLLDTSWSTGYQLGSDAALTVHEREKRAAKDIVRQLRPVDRLSLVAFDETARKVYVTPRTVDARAQREILDELDSLPELQRGARGSDFAAAFHLLPSVLGQFDQPNDPKPSPKTIFVLSDMQRTALLAPGGLSLRDATLRGVLDDVKRLGGSIYLVDCGAEEPKNAGIVTLETREPIVGVNLPCYIDCNVKNFGTLAPTRGPKGEALAGLTLEYFVDGSDAPVKAVSLDLAPEELKQLEPLRYVFHEKGPHRVVARLRSDALQLDNERALVVDVREAVEVLLVDGEPKPGKYESETDFLRKALDPFAVAGKDLIRTETVTEPMLPVGLLKKYDLIVLANVVSLPDDHVAALEQYAREGGAIVFTMGSLVDREHYNDKLWRRGAGLFPCQLGDVKGNASSERSADRDPNAPEWVLALATNDHPALRVFADEELKPVLKEPSVFRFVSATDLTTAPEKGKPALAGVPLKLVPRPREASDTAKEDPNALKDAVPAFVEKAFGRGRVATWLTTVDIDWSNAAAYNFYVIFWRQIALELARTSRPRRNLSIGDRYERIIGTGEYAPTVEVVAPDGMKETFRPEPVEGREQFRIAYPPAAEARVEKDPSKKADDGIDRPGIFEVRLTGAAGDGIAPPVDYFAVRVDPAEGDVAKLDLEDWKEQLPGVEIRRASPDALGDPFQSGVPGQRDDELWPLAVAAVIGLLAVESILAALFGRRRQ